MAIEVAKLFFFIFFLLPLLSHSSPFGFLKHLQGCHKGENLKGVHQLKQYFKKFGYLNCPQNYSHCNDDNFDDFLEEAVKTYQLNYHLNATGTLDPQTVSKMMTPRCGVADIINGKNTMRGGNKRQNDHNSHSFHTVSHYSFFEGSPRWPPTKTHLTFGFLPGTPVEAINPVEQAFNQWAGATQYFTFSRTEDYSNADLKISFQRGDHGDGAPFNGAGEALAHAFAPTDGRFHYDADEVWSVGPVPGAIDLETVALHEIGHLLGLGHSAVENAIMYSSLPSGVTKGLHGDDIEGMNQSLV